MEFINTSVDVNNIPHINDVSLNPIHTDYLKILRYEWMLTTVALVIAGGAIIFFNDSVRSSFWWLAIAAFVIILSALYYFLQEKSFPFKAYSVRDKDVIYQNGWIIRNVMVCPFNRIQNCSVQSGPWERKFHLATLIVYTAGTEEADIKIRGLLQEEAEKLRHFILDKIHSEANETV